MRKTTKNEGQPLSTSPSWLLHSSVSTNRLCTTRTVQVPPGARSLRLPSPASRPSPLVVAQKRWGRIPRDDFADGIHAGSEVQDESAAHMRLYLGRPCLKQIQFSDGSRFSSHFQTRAVQPFDLISRADDFGRICTASSCVRRLEMNDRWDSDSVGEPVNITPELTDSGRATSQLRLASPLALTNSKGRGGSNVC